MPQVSVVIPTYDAPDLLREAIASVLSQDFTDFELVVVDDCSPPGTREVVEGFLDPRVRYHRNATNLGLGANVRECVRLASCDLVVFLCHDDILLRGALGRTVAALQSPGVAVVTRPYYWFEDDARIPVRAIPPADPDRDVVLDVRAGPEVLHAIFRSVGQLSGLGFRKAAIRVPFQDDIFTTHIAPFASCLRVGKVAFLHDATVAVRIGSSMTRHRPDIYRKSPTESWIEMFGLAFPGDEFAEVRRQGIDFICGTNHEGLVQLRATGGVRVLLREARILLAHRPRNAFSPRFWSFFLGTLLLPPRAVRWLADTYKRRVLARRLEGTVDPGSLPAGE